MPIAKELPTERQKDAIEAAILANSASSTVIAKALNIAPASAHRLLARANAKGELAKYREEQRDKARGISRSIVALVERIGRGQVPDDWITQVAGLSKLLEAYEKMQSMGLTGEEERAPEQVRASIQRRKYRHMLIGAKLHARGVKLEQIRARLLRS